MAFSDILKRQKSSDGGILSAIILTSDDGQDKLNSVSKNAELSAKNTSVLPSIAKSMLSIQNNIAKLVKIQTETIKQRQQGFFAQQRIREDTYESRMGFRRTSPSAISGREKKDSSGFGFLSSVGSFISSVFSALLSSSMLTKIGIGVLVGYLFNDPKFREGIRSVIVGIFNVLAEGFSGLKDLFSDESVRQSFKKAVESFFSALGAFFSLPVGEIFGVEVNLGQALIGVIGTLAAFKGALIAATIRLGMLGLGGRGGLPPILPDGVEDERRGGGRGRGRGAAASRAAAAASANQGKLLTDFGSVGQNRELEKNKSLSKKITDRLNRIKNNPRAYGILAKALAKRVGTAALVALTGTLLSGGILLPLIMGLLTIYSAVEILQALDETEKELKQPEGLEELSSTTGQSGIPSPTRTAGISESGSNAPYAYAGSEQSLPHKEAMRRFAAGGYNHGRTIEFRDPTTGLMASGVHRVHEALINSDIVFPEGSINLRDPEAIRKVLRHVKERTSASDYFSSGRAAHDLMRDEFDVASRIATLEQQIIDAERFQSNARAGTIQGFDRTGRPLGTSENESLAETRRMTRVSGKDGLDLLNRIMDQEGITDPATRQRLIQLAYMESGLRIDAQGPMIQGGMHRGDRAQGLLQIMPKTAPEVGFSSEDIQDPEKAAVAGVRYFMKNLSRFQGNLDAATVAHHAGPGQAQRFVDTGSTNVRDRATGLTTMNYLASVRSRQVAGFEPGNIRNAGLTTMSAAHAGRRNADFGKLEPMPVYLVDKPGSTSSSPGRLPGTSPMANAPVPTILDESLATFLTNDMTTFFGA